MGEKFLGMLLGLLVGVLLARYLAPTQFGVYSFVLAVIALVAPLSELGLNAIITRELVRKTEMSSQILGSAFILRFCGTFVVGSLTLLTVKILKPAEDDLFFYLAILFFANLFTVLSLVNFWFEAVFLSKYVSIARCIVLITMTIARIGFIKLGASLTTFIMLIGIELIITGFAMMVTFLLQKRSPRHWTFNRIRALALLKESWPLILSGFAATIYLKIDQIMLAEMVSEAAVGTYAVASRVSEVWYIVPTVIANSLFPKIVELSDRDPDKFKTYLQMGYDLLFCLALLIALPISLCAKPIIVTLFGSAYEQAAPILAVHVWAGLFIFMRALFSKWLVVEHLLLFSLISHGFGAIANVLMNLLLIPLQGALGAAIATVISYSASSYLALFLSNKTRPAAFMMSIAFTAPLRLVKIYRNLG